MIVRFPRRSQRIVFLHHYKLLSVLVLLLATICYFFIDIPVAKYFETIPSSVGITASFLTNLIDPKYNLFIWPSVYFYTRFVLKKETIANYCLILIVSISASNLVAEMIKTLAGRARPVLLFNQDLYGFFLFQTSNAFQSFPSGHACTVGAICGCICFFYPLQWVKVFIVSFLLACTRVVLNYHYVGDIFAGLLVGILISQWVSEKMKKIK